MRAVAFVMVEPRAGSQRQGVGGMEGIFGEQRPSIDADRVGIDRIALDRRFAGNVLDFLRPVLGAELQHVAAEWQRQQGIQRGIGGFWFRCALAAAGPGFLLADFLVQRQRRIRPAPATVVGNGPVVARMPGFQVGGIVGQRPAGRAFVGQRIVAGLEGQVLVGARRDRQFGGQAAVAGALGAAGAVARIEHMVFRPVAVIAVHLEADQAVADRSAKPEVALAGIAVARVLLEDAAQIDRTVPLRRHLAGNDVDHAAHRIRTVQRRHRPAHHFDALDGFQRRDHARLYAAGTAVHGLAGVLPLAVDHDQRVFAGHAADRDVLLAAFADDADPFQMADGVLQVGERLAFQILAREHRDAGRCFLDFLFVAGGRDHHVGQGHGGVTGRLRGQRAGGVQAAEGAGDDRQAHGRSACRQRDDLFGMSHGNSDIYVNTGCGAVSWRMQWRP